MNFQAVEDAVDVAGILANLLDEEDDVATRGEIVGTAYEWGDGAEIAAHQDALGCAWLVVIIALPVVMWYLTLQELDQLLVVVGFALGAH